MKYLYASTALLLFSCTSTQDAVEQAKYTGEYILANPEEFVHIGSQVVGGVSEGGLVGGGVALLASLWGVYEKAKRDAVKKVNVERDLNRVLRGEIVDTPTKT